jgi:NAD+ diphosphatase
MHLPAPDAATFAQARSLIDWNARNPFCAQCGQPTLSINAGWKRTCPPGDLAAVSSIQGSTASQTPSSRPPCATRTGIHNISFPRSDPTVIAAVVSYDGTRVLLGRQKRWPRNWYSALAGFVEPAESVEEAIRREVWEESGVRLGRVVVHSTQPWPYPANLMIGAIAQAVEGGEDIVLEHDPELEDARWVPLEEVREALRVGTRRLDQEKSDGDSDEKEGLRLPPKTAIANRLLTAVAEGFLGADSKM